MGGLVRVGLEDNIYSQRGVLTTNMRLVEKAVRLAHEFEREIATPDEARAMLKLKGLSEVNFQHILHLIQATRIIGKGWFCYGSTATHTGRLLQEE